MVVSRRFDDAFEVQTLPMRSHRSLFLARAGGLPAQALARYLGSVLHLLRQTEPHLKRAEELATGLGLQELAAYFSRKLSEEKGHDSWAEADLRALSEHLASELDSEPLPAVHALVAFIDELIDEDPLLYLVYIVTNEYLMVSAGPAWLSALTQGSEVPASALTVLDRHIAADQAHTEAGLEDAERLLPGSFSRSQVERVIARTVELLDALFTQIAGGEPGHQTCAEPAGCSNAPVRAVGSR